LFTLLIFVKTVMHRKTDSRHLVIGYES